MYNSLHWAIETENYSTTDSKKARKKKYRENDVD